MDSIIYKKIINIGNHNTYELIVYNNYKVVFQILSGVDRYNNTIILYDDFGSRLSGTGIINVLNPVITLRKIVDEFVFYVNEFKPPFLMFSAREESRKKLYKRLSILVLKRIRYTTVYNHNGYYLMIKKRNTL